MFSQTQKRPAPSAAVPVLRLLLVLLNPLSVVLACQTVSLQNISKALSWMLSSPKPLLVYCLTLLLTQLTVAGLTRLSGLGGLLAALPPLGITLASYYKGVINGEPLMLSDLELAGELGNILGFTRITVSGCTWFALLCVFLPFVLLTVLDILSLLGHDRFRLSFPRGLILGGICGALLALFVTFGLRPYCLNEYRSYPVQSYRDKRLGVSLSLLSHWYCARPTPSAAYSQARLQRILADMEAALDEREPSDVRPHIIFVMNESFSDITRLDGLNYSRDPLSNLHRLQGENTTYGRFYTTTCGGGTGRVEVEAFTGLSLEELDASASGTDLDPELYDAMPSYVRVLKENGYRTVSFHSHTADLYNRDKNYPHLGFDRVLFRDAYEADATFSGGYFDDNSTADVIISLFEENRDAPTFLYAMTMQNHQPYHTDRYAQLDVDVTSSLLTREELDGVSCYVQGLYDADRMLGRLVDYFSQVDEPVLLFFAGDHIPGLIIHSRETVYTRLGAVSSPISSDWSAEDYRNMMATDYIIWSNFQDGEGEVPNGTMSIGATVLDLAGVRSTPFFAWMDKNRRETMLFHARILTLDPAGQITSLEEPAIKAFHSAYADVIYDMLYGKHYIAAAANRVRD